LILSFHQNDNRINRPRSEKAAGEGFFRMNI
jgi:hypothetical protein